MKTRKSIIIFLLVLLAIEFVTTNSLLTFSTLFVSEEEGIVKNVEYNERLHSSEESQASDIFGGSNETSIIAQPPAETMENTFKIFLRVLIRDSRQVTKTKLQEVKELQNVGEVSVGRFFVTLKRINNTRPTNEAREGKFIYDYIKEMIENTEGYMGNDNQTAWLNKIIERITNLAQNVHSDNEIENVIENIKIEQEINEHFDLFMQFWLNYRHGRTRRHLKELSKPNDREINETLCVIDKQNLPLSTTHITYSAFAKIMKRDSAKVIENKLKEAKLQQRVNGQEYLKRLEDTLRVISAHKFINITEDGNSIYKSLKEIQSRSVHSSQTSWVDNLVDRIFCQAQKTRSDKEVQDLIEHFNMEDTIREHFAIFMHFWWNCAIFPVKTADRSYGTIILCIA